MTLKIIGNKVEGQIIIERHVKRFLTFNPVSWTATFHPKKNYLKKIVITGTNERDVTRHAKKIRDLYSKGITIKF